MHPDETTGGQTSGEWWVNVSDVGPVLSQRGVLQWMTKSLAGSAILITLWSLESDKQLNIILLNRLIALNARHVTDN